MAEVWVKWHVRYFDDPKVRAAGKDGAWLYAAALLYAKDQLTDGFIPKDQVPVLAAQAWAQPRGAKALVREGLWLEVDGGYQVARWGEWHQPAEAVEKERLAKASGAAVTNHQRWHVARKVVEPTCRLCVSDPPSDTNQSQKRSLERSDQRSGGRSLPGRQSTENRENYSSRELSSQTPGSDDDSEDPRIGEALAIVAQRRAPDRPARYRARVAANLRSEEALDVDAARLCADHPDAPASLIAAALAGDDARNLAHFRRRTSSDPPPERNPAAAAAAVADLRARLTRKETA